MTEPAIEPVEEHWDARVKALLKAELKRKGVTYAQLVEKLAAVGVKETEPNIRNKLARGKFTAVFFVQCLTAIGCHNIALDN
ncbi:DUF6471 domain-containing protein [Methylobacterium sp. Leaf469]|uniref:DUF6471 domain-containing protein n=1 Tax=Methylobacterium sp. Leaf469 TaxID=1736387 RepID=UPI0009E85AF6|nr:DUF6471 domain-containing protein [Methylobacterium sp. Leaf469]